MSDVIERGIGRTVGRSDEGVAMVAILGILAVVTVIAVSAYFLGSQSLHESTMTADRSSAFQVASAGLDKALATIQMRGYNPASYPMTGTVANMGSYEVSVTPDPSGEYEALSTGTSSRNGSQERIRTKFFYLNLWDISMGAGEGASLGGGSGWNGNAAVDGPLYVRGDLLWTSNANYSRGPLFIKDGSLNITGSGLIGSSARPVHLYSVSPVLGKTGQFFGSQSNSCPDIELPWVDDSNLAAYWAIAVNQSTDNLMGADSTVVNWECDANDPATYETALNTPADGQVSGLNAPLIPEDRVRPWVPGPGDSLDYKYIGPATGPSPLRFGTTTLTIGPTSFGAYPGHGFTSSATNLYDDFAFDASTGTLYLNGIVLVDGDVTLGPEVREYVGRGILVANGDITIQGRFIPQLQAGETTPTFNPSRCAGLVAAGGVRIEDAAMAAIFCNDTFSLYQTHTYFVGTALAGNIYGDLPNITITMDPTLKDNLPKDMPASNGGMLAMTAWTRP